MNKTQKIMRIHRIIILCDADIKLYEDKLEDARVIKQTAQELLMKLESEWEDELDEEMRD